MNSSEAPADKLPLLCVIVPCYDEEEMLPAFFRAVCPALEEAVAGKWSILCVDDGSRDRTFAVITEWNAVDPRIRGVRLSRNFGHQAAISAGLVYACGEHVGLMDCDLQDPVQVLVELYRRCVDEGLDVCYGIRGKRDAPFYLRIAYSAFYYLINKTADHPWPRNVGDFCVISRRCHETLLALPEKSRMFRGLRSWVGFRQAGVNYNRPARLHGQSKYNIPRLITLALQGLISFSHVPLRAASFIGLAMGVFSILFAMLAIMNRLLPQFTLFGYWVGASPGVTTLLVFSALALSVLFLCLGIVGEYLIVLLQELKNRPTAIIAAAVGNPLSKQAAYPLQQALSGSPPRTQGVKA